MTKIKICGIRRTQDAEYLNEFKPDYAGFILSKPFRRYINIEQLNIINEILSPEIKRVGVFVNENVEYILQFSYLLDVIQLHGDETNDFIADLKSKTSCEIWKAVRVQTSDEIEKACSLPVDKLLIDSYSKDSYGGTGKTADWELVKNTKMSKPFFLAGGISYDNCVDAINTVNPFGLDISSSVETDKIKDKNKIKQIILKIKNKQ